MITIPEPELQAFLAQFSPAVQEVTLRLRELVRSHLPEAVEQLDLPARMLAYGFQATYKDLVCVVMPLKAAVNLGFPRGVDLPDPAGLLEGTGKRARHVKIRSLADLDRPELLSLLEAGIEQARGVNK